MTGFLSRISNERGVLSNEKIAIGLWNLTPSPSPSRIKAIERGSELASDEDSLAPLSMTKKAGHGEGIGVRF
jgi:hypothetical protein